MADNPHDSTETIGTNLVLRPVRDAQDAERFVALSATVNGEAEGVMAARLIHHHPSTTFDDYLLVEDERTSEVVSTTCLIPWQLQFDGLALNAAMLEMVVTHPSYRRRGLVRAQVERYHRTIAARGFDLSIIQGIPYYYRQYGYAYALDHQPCQLLSASSIPAPLRGELDVYQVRRAASEDAPALTMLYAQALSPNNLFTVRSQAYWRFLLADAHWDVRLLERQDGSALAYAAVRPWQEQDSIDVSESGATSYASAMALLYQLRQETHRVIRLGGTGNGAVLKAAHSLGSAPQPNDQWLVRVADMASFLARLAPAFERRLAASDCAGFSASFVVNLYREAFALRFERGTLAGVDGLGFVDASMGADGGDLCIPRDAFTRLVLGYRRLDDLRDAWPDIVVRPGSRRVLDVLFPRLPSCVWMPY